MKIMLLSDVPPCTNYSGGLMLLQLARFLREGDLSCFAVILRPWVNPVVPEDMHHMAMEVAQKPRQRWNVFPGWRGRLVSAVMESLIATFVLPAIVRRAVRFGKAQGVEGVWCVLAGQTMIRLARPIARGLGVPLYTHVMDPPYWWLRENQVDARTTRLVLEEFSAALRDSKRCASASPGMQRAFSAEHGVDSVPIVSCLPAEMAVPAVSAPRADGELVIGMAGQLYAREEWDALLGALDGCAWTVAGRAVRLRLLGEHPGIVAGPGQRIEVLGWKPQSEAIRILSEADVLYCPYWFDPVFKAECSQSFPSKLTSYLAAARPVLVHAPDYASPAVFVAEHRAGLACTSLAHDEIRAALERICSEPGLYETLSRNARTTFLAELTTDSMRNRFREFLGADAVQNT